MNKIITTLLLLIGLFFSFFSSPYATNVLLKVTVLDHKSEVPLEGFVLRKSVSGGGEAFHVTNKEGIVEFNYKYIEGESDLAIYIDNNYVLFENIYDPEERIHIYYDKEKERIDRAVGPGDKRVINQERVKATNYIGLLIFFFLTLVLGTIIVLGKIFYSKLYLDAVKHNKRR